MRKRMDPKAAFHHLAEDDEEEQVFGGLNHLSHETLGSMEESHRCSRLGGAAENVMPRSTFPKISTEETERSKSGPGRSCPSELLKDSHARSRGRLQT